MQRFRTVLYTNVGDGGDGNDDDDGSDGDGDDTVMVMIR